MSNRHAAFVGSIPENYDRYLGPLLFEPYAEDIVQRLQVPAGAAVLELACGTGIVTRRLRDGLPQTAKLTTTDLNEAMLEHAARKFRPEDAVELRQADATELPFPDSSFNAVVCQFGLMFFPDKPAAMRQVHRVLADGGQFVFNVWDSIEKNEMATIARDTICSYFDTDPPTFYDVPFGLYDHQELQTLMDDAGFKNTSISVVLKPGISPSAIDAATGFIRGNPIIADINERARSSAAEIIEALAAAFRSRCGDNPVRMELSAVVCTARR